MTICDPQMTVTLVSQTRHALNHAPKIARPSGAKMPWRSENPSQAITTRNGSDGKRNSHVSARRLYSPLSIWLTLGASDGEKVSDILLELLTPIGSQPRPR